MCNYSLIKSKLNVWFRKQRAVAPAVTYVCLLCCRCYKPDFINSDDMKFMIFKKLPHFPAEANCEFIALSLATSEGLIKFSM